MLTTNFLKIRTSTRDYLDKEISEEDKKKVFDLVKEEAEKFEKDNLNFIVKTDGDIVYNALKGLAGYAGVMIKSPMYIGLNTLNKEEKTYVLGAYASEELITKLNEIGLATCWVTIADVEKTVKKNTFNFESGDVNQILAVGYPVSKEVKEHRYDDRLGITDIVFMDDFNNNASLGQLEQYGLDDLFHYARFAPSAYNAQPWRFLINDDGLNLYIKDYKGVVNLVDAGIIMYYIDELTKDLSNNSKWEILPEIKGEEYTFVAKKSL